MSKEYGRSFSAADQPQSPKSVNRSESYLTPADQSGVGILPFPKRQFGCLSAAVHSVWGAMVSFLIVLALVVLPEAPVSAQGRQFAGRSERQFVPHSKKTEAVEKRAVLAQLEEQAREDAVGQALIAIYGSKARFGDMFPTVIVEAYRHSSMFVRDSEIRAAGVLGDTAAVEVALSIDEALLRKFIQDNFEMSAAGDVEHAFRVHVLAYTVEGMDPDRANPQLLREEISDDRKNVQSSSSSFDVKNVQASSEAARSQSASSLDVDARKASSYSGRSTDKQSLDANGSARSTAYGSVRSDDGAARAYASSASSGHVRASGESSSATDERSASSLAVAARAQSSAASSTSNYSDTSAKGAQAGFSDASTSYRSLRVFVDSTKKGAGQTNEIRAKLGELLKASGFVTVNSTLTLQSEEYRNEDELNASVMSTLRGSPDFEPNDFLALACSRLTPVNPSNHEFTASVTFRVSRISDGLILMPDQLVTGESGPAASDDVARVLATELAIKRAEPIFTERLVQSIRQYQRQDERATQKRSSEYEIRISGISSPVAVMPMQTALRSAGFDVKFTFRNGTEVIAIPVNGQDRARVLSTLEPFLANYDVVSMDEFRSELKAK